MDDSWIPDPSFGSYSTAVDTRSLSVSMFPDANTSSNLDPNGNSSANVALLYYEKPNGKVSALLHRSILFYSPFQDQWLDITSQESKDLSHEFRNTPGFNYSDSNAASHTLYEADPNTVYSTPFSRAADYGSSPGALFHSSSVPVDSSFGDSFSVVTYDIGLSGPGNFSFIQGMHYASSYAGRNFLK